MSLKSFCVKRTWSPTGSTILGWSGNCRKWGLDGGSRLEGVYSWWLHLVSNTFSHSLLLYSLSLRVAMKWPMLLSQDAPLHHHLSMDQKSLKLWAQTILCPLKLFSREFWHSNESLTTTDPSSLTWTDIVNHQWVGRNLIDRTPGCWEREPDSSDYSSNAKAAQASSLSLQNIRHILVNPENTSHFA